jgi:CDP-glycerol:poly(glycerophosphate) glycerophosphotransferase
MTLDFFARLQHYIDHLAPIWNALPPERRGQFHTTVDLVDYTRQELNAANVIEVDGYTPSGDSPILCAAYGDMSRAARNPGRRIITIEHGTGHGFGTAAYPNATKGRRDLVDLALMPNAYTADLSRSVRSTHCEVIGTPKMDEWSEAAIAREPRYNPLDNPLVIAIAFHWGDRHANPPESGSAFEHYQSILPRLAKRYHVIAHGHPLASPAVRQIFEQAGIEWVSNLREVFSRADILINDLSSILYEFIVTGKPVIVLNAPWFRREVNWGIRFWDYSDVGINVEGPGELFSAIDRTIAEYGTICTEERRRAVADLYPYLGCSAQRAAEVLTTYLDGKDE